MTADPADPTEDQGPGRWRLRWWPASGLVGSGTARLAHVGHRSRQVLLLAGATGAVVGLVVAGIDRGLIAALDAVGGLPLGARAMVPMVGLAMAFGIRKVTHDRSTATADEYVRVFHSTRPLDTRPVPGRLAAAAATLGSGAPLGYEAPALYAGAAIGTAVQERFRRFFGGEERHLLMVAGAAAGVSAIFKAPVTGLVFALEVPYEDDLAHHMLLPAAISSAASYLVFAALAGTEPLLPLTGHPGFDLRDLLAAAAVGVVAGVFANLFVRLVGRAKRMASGLTVARMVAAGLVVAAAVVIGDQVADAPISLGPGYQLLRWALDPATPVAVIVAVATLRVLATTSTLAGGGVGGLFVPLVIQGAMVGRVIEGLVPGAEGSLLPVVGMAAFLGAGYQVPLAAVVFVAEFTGRPAFVVPGLIAAVVAQLVAGSRSVCPYQRSGDDPLPSFTGEG